MEEKPRRWKLNWTKAIINNLPQEYLHLLYFFLTTTVVVNRYKDRKALLIFHWVGQETLIMELSIADKLFQRAIDFFNLFLSLIFLVLNELIKVGTNQDCG